ncbi:MAG TPA: dephospho-CoA kinase [Thermoleophilaceae bacterium]|nr:dephospho-CoA kinase [Thermoleophilaceae bacterium]
MSAGEAEGRLPFVGLTGGMAAGKTEALRALERLGAATISSDEIVHELLATDELRDLLVERFGERVAPGGSVDRSAVAEVAFDDPERRAWLEGELWPRVGQRIAAWREELVHRSPPPRAAVVEVPLLFEAGMETGFEATVAIVAPERTRNERAGARGHPGTESRTSRQLSQEEKAERANHVVENDGDLASLERKMADVLDALTR